jgi:hypothetical protein
VIATKFGLVPGDGYGGYVISGRPHYVRRACGASLKRLGTDHIDPYYQHRVSAFGRRLHVKHRSPCSGAAVIAEPLREFGCPHWASGSGDRRAGKASGRGLHDRATVPPTGLLPDRPSGRRKLLLAVRIPLQRGLADQRSR